jgi:hypothetical protein
MDVTAGVIADGAGALEPVESARTPASAAKPPRSNA